MFPGTYYYNMVRRGKTKTNAERCQTISYDFMPILSFLH